MRTYVLSYSFAVSSNQIFSFQDENYYYIFEEVLRILITSLSTFFVVALCYVTSNIIFNEVNSATLLLYCYTPYIRTTLHFILTN